MPLKLRCSYQFIAMAGIAYVMARKRNLESNLVFYRKVSRTASLEALQSPPFWMYASSSVLLGQSIRNPEGMEERNHLLWENGYHSWTDDQFKKRLRVKHETFQYNLGAISDDISKVTIKFKEPTSPACHLGLTVHCLAHGCSYSAAGDFFDVVLSTASTIFNTVINVIVQSMFDDLVTLPQRDEEQKKELTSFIGDWDNVHVMCPSGCIYLSCKIFIKFLSSIPCFKCFIIPILILTTSSLRVC